MLIGNRLMLKEGDFVHSRSLVTLAGVGLAMTLANPFDLIRIRMQTMVELVEIGSLKRSYKGILDCGRRISHEEGFRAFWKGNSANLLRFYSSQTVNFLSKESIKEPLASTSLFTPNGFSLNFLSGVLGSWLALSILYPLQHARNQQTFNISNSSKSIMRSIYETLAKSGIKGLYTGSSISMFGVAMFRGTYFGVFDTFKGEKTGVKRWSVAYLSSLLAIMVTYPTDTIRRRLICSRAFKSKYSGFSDCSRQVYQKQGVRSFFRGSPIIFFQSLSCSTILFFYDMVSKDLQSKVL